MEDTKETIVEGTPEETPEAEKTPSIEDRLATLEATLQEKDAAIAEITADRDSKGKGLRTAHQRLEEKNKENKRNVSNMATLIDGLANSGSIDPEVATKIKADAESAERQAAQEEYMEKAADIWQQTQVLGFTQDTDEGSDIYDILNDGLPSSLSRATRMLKKLEATAKEPKKEETVVNPENKETEEQKIARKAQELLRQSPGFKAEAPEPSGGDKRFYTPKQIDDMPIEEYAKQVQAIEDAQRGGRIRK